MEARFIGAMSAAERGLAANCSQYPIRQGRYMFIIDLSKRCWLMASVAILACQSSNGSGTPANTIGSVERVRPDVREYIESAVSSEYEKQAALQYAAALQGKLDATGDKEQIKKLAEVGFGAMDCMAYVFPSSKAFSPQTRAEVIQREVEARTYNTKERALARVRNSKLLSGSVWRARKEGEFSKACDFDLTGFTPQVLP
jgi:hypothetical protein